jgi:hypothetical protein
MPGRKTSKCARQTTLDSSCISVLTSFLDVVLHLTYTVAASKPVNRLSPLNFSTIRNLISCTWFRIKMSNWSKELEMAVGSTSKSGECHLISLVNFSWYSPRLVLLSFLWSCVARGSSLRTLTHLVLCMDASLDFYFSRFAPALLVTCTHHAPVHHHTCATEHNALLHRNVLREAKPTEGLVTSDHFLDDDPLAVSSIRLPRPSTSLVSTRTHTHQTASSALDSGRTYAVPSRHQEGRAWNLNLSSSLESVFAIVMMGRRERSPCCQLPWRVCVLSPKR